MCELCAAGAQGVRAADCKNLSESPEGDFDSLRGCHYGSLSIHFWEAMLLRMSALRSLASASWRSTLEAFS